MFLLGSLGLEAFNISANSSFENVSRFQPLLWCKTLIPPSTTRSEA